MDNTQPLPDDAADVTAARFERLWTPADVAWYLAASEGYVRGLRDTDPSFPRPLALPGGRLIRWHSADVVEWVKGLEPPHGPDATDQPTIPRRGRKRTHVF